MSRRYPLEEKAAALDRLQASGGHIALTSLQTGIPERPWRDLSLTNPPFSLRGISGSTCSNRLGLRLYNGSTRSPSNSGAWVRFRQPSSVTSTVSECR